MHDLIYDESKSKVLAAISARFLLKKNKLKKMMLRGITILEDIGNYIA